MIVFIDDVIYYRTRLNEHIKYHEFTRIVLPDCLQDMNCIEHILAQIFRQFSRQSLQLLTHTANFIWEFHQLLDRQFFSYNSTIKASSSCLRIIMTELCIKVFVFNL